MAIRLTNTALEAGRLRLTQYRSARLSGVENITIPTAALLGWCEAYLTLVIDLADQVINAPSDDGEQSIDSIADALEVQAQALRDLPRPAALDMDEVRDVLRRANEASDEVGGYLDEVSSNVKSAGRNRGIIDNHLAELESILDG